MTVALIGYGFVIGLLTAAAASACERVCRIAGRPVRWAWAGGLALTVVLIGVAPLRPRSISSPIPSVVRAGTISVASRAPLAVPTPWEKAIVELMPRVPASLERSIAQVWLAASTLLVLLYAVVFLRFQLMRRRWPIAELQGVRVRLAPDGGPVVVGLSRQEIVVPRWLLWYSPEEQRLVLIHESEHVRARDPLM